MPDGFHNNDTMDGTEFNDSGFGILYDFSSVYLAVVGLLGIGLNSNALTKLNKRIKVSSDPYFYNTTDKIYTSLRFRVPQIHLNILTLI